MQRALGHCVTRKLIGKLWQQRAAERQVAEVILERREARDCVAVYAESGEAVGDHLLGLRDDLKDRAAPSAPRQPAGTRRPLQRTPAQFRRPARTRTRLSALRSAGNATVVAPWRDNEQHGTRPQSRGSRRALAPAGPTVTSV